MLQLDHAKRQETVVKAVAIGADHAGYELKDQLKAFLQAQNITVNDVGTYSADATDYADYAHVVAGLVEDRQVDYGVLICGTGIGMSMAANRHAGIRAAVCPSTEHARLGRAHNDANVLCLGARLTPASLAEEILSIFVATPFEGGRHRKRVSKLTP